jgi:non-heme chloroperoxidase
MRNFLFWTCIALISLPIFANMYLHFNRYQIDKAPEKYTFSRLMEQPHGETDYIMTDDSTMLQAISAGTGTPIVLAHGFGGSMRNWNLVFDQLVSEGYQVITFSQRGHKESTVGKNGISSKAMAEDYKRVLEYYDVKNGVLVGHSMGGFLNVAFLLNHPEVAKERLKGAMILSSFAGDISRDNFQNSIQIPMIEKGWMKKIVAHDITGYTFCGSLIGDNPYASLVDVGLQDFRQQNFEPLLPILRAFSNENYYNRLKEINLPCTIMVGEKDKTAPSFHSEDLKKGIPNAKLVKLAGKGHLINWEAPDEIVAEIKKLAGSPVVEVVPAPVVTKVKAKVKMR